jgi:hypothetical protein
MLVTISQKAFRRWAVFVQDVRRLMLIIVLCTLVQVVIGLVVMFVNPAYNGSAVNCFMFQACVARLRLHIQCIASKQAHSNDVLKTCL